MIFNNVPHHSAAGTGRGSWLSAQGQGLLSSQNIMLLLQAMGEAFSQAITSPFFDHH